MKKTANSCTHIAIIAFLLLSTSLSAETWKVTSLEWRPYSGSDLANKGNSVQKLKSLLKAEGIDLVVEFYPWKRAQIVALKPGYAGYFPAWPEEVAKGFIASVPVDWSDLGVLTYEGSNAVWTTVEDLFKKYKVGIIETYVYPDYIKKAIEKYPHNVEPSFDEPALLVKIANKRIEAALTDPAVMLYLARKENISNIRILKKSVERKALVIAFRDSPETGKRIAVIKKIMSK